MAEPIHQMEEEVESIVEKHQLEEMERASVAPKDTEEDDIEPELQRIKVCILEKSFIDWVPEARNVSYFENWLKYF